MANVPADLMYTADHEWVHVEKDGTVRVGITDFAQNALGDIVFLELPPEGRSVQIGDEIGTIESVKSVSELYSPVDGEVVAVNQDVVDSPEGVNSDPYDAWLVSIKLAAGAKLDELLDAAAYEKLIG
ncbi:glycine cleavage system protein GcvH [Streptacidiphilus sp. MAP5-3]|uniref:glycine cleavage system protein GcvH n=1 Tax=unclassified Streptacidiphilus TaxID=2643834 RepID=UPI0035151774